MLIHLNTLLKKTFLTGTHVISILASQSSISILMLSSFKMFRPKFIHINVHIRFLEFLVLPLFVISFFMLLCYIYQSSSITLYVKQPKPLPLFTMKFQFDLCKYVISQENV